MHCGHRGHHSGPCGCGYGGHHGRDCGCGGSHHLRRRYWTKEEKTAWLEQYLDDLRAEAEVVEERIAYMKGEG